jgi:hypothetical protein
MLSAPLLSARNIQPVISLIDSEWMYNIQCQLEKVGGQVLRSWACHRGTPKKIAIEANLLHTGSPAARIEVRVALD